MTSSKVRVCGVISKEILVVSPFTIAVNSYVELSDPVGRSIVFIYSSEELLFEKNTMPAIEIINRIKTLKEISFALYNLTSFSGLSPM